MTASRFTLASAALLTELHGWFDFGTVGTGDTIRIVIYKHVSGTDPTNATLVAYTDLLHTTGSGTPFELSQAGFGVSLAAGDYWIGFWTATGSNSPRARGAASGSAKSILSGVVDPPPAVYGAPNYTYTNEISCWAVVTSGGAILGNNVKGSSAQGIAPGGMKVTLRTLATPMTLTELHGWFRGGAGKKVRVIIYADSAGSPGARVAYTNLLTLTGVDVILSQTGFNVPLAAGSYWVGFYGDPLTITGAEDCIMNNFVGTYKGIASGVPDPPSDPFGSANQSGSRDMNCWAVLAAASAPAFVPQIVIT